MAKHSAPPRTKVPTFVKALPALSLATVLVLSGCGIPGLPGPTGAPAAGPAIEQVSVEETVAEKEAVTPADLDPAETVPVGIAAPEPAPARVIQNDLATGSASHTLGAADNHLVIDYWTTENVAMWTPESTPIIRLSAKVVGSIDWKQVKITRFNARVDSLDAILANDTGDFAIGAPNAYSSAVVLPGNPGAESTRIVFTFDLLTETFPGSEVFTRQTVMDSLIIGYPATAIKE